MVRHKRARTRRRARVGKGNKFNRTFGRHGYHHQIRYQVELQGDDATNDTNTFIAPICAMDTTMSNADSVYVNPRHSARTTPSNNALTYGGSVVKRIHYSIQEVVPPSGFESNIFAHKIYTMPICVRYDDLTKDAVGNKITDFIPIAEHGTREKIIPNYNGNDLTGLAMDDTDGLTASSAPEAVTFGQNAFEEALSENPISPLLLKITEGGLREHTLYREWPKAYTGTFSVPGKVQLQTDRTFYALLISLGQASIPGHQYYTTDEVTDVDHVRIDMNFSYYEFNKEFNQGIS